MKVLVTGATGLVGSAISVHLLARGHEVVALSRNAKPWVPEGVEWVQGDLGSPSFLDDLVRKVSACNAIVHSAASINQRPDATEISLANCLGTHNALLLATRWNAGFVFLSSIAVIGRPQHVPITEEHPVAPQNPYQASKLFGEHLVRICRPEGNTGAILRLTAPVADRMPPERILAVFVRRAMAGEPLALHGTGARRQNYVDVRDIAGAVEQCLDQHVSGVFNVGGLETVSNYELAERCVRLLGSKSPIIFTGQPDRDDDVVWQVSSEKAHRTFSYTPRYALDNTIVALAASFQK